MSEERPQTRIQIAGSQQSCRTTHRHLKVHTNFEVIKPYITEEDDLVETVEQSTPGILVLHIQADAPFSPDVIQGLEDLIPPPHVVVISSTYDPDLLAARNHPAIRATLLSEMATTPLFIAVMEAVNDGFTYHAASPDAAEAYDFTPLETCVLRLMAVGFENTQLVTRLERKADSIYYTQRRIRLKLGVDTNEQALVTAIRDGVVSVLGRLDDLPARNRAA